MQDIVRLPEKSISAIITAFKQNFAAEDHLWIFGSRVDMQARGGDIDLYIETTITDIDLVIKRKIKMTSNIWHEIGEQKIDIVLNILSLKSDLPIYLVAKTNGVKLA